MVGLMSHSHLLRADRVIMWDLQKRLSGIIIPCRIVSNTRLIGKVDAKADNAHIISECQKSRLITGGKQCKEKTFILLPCPPVTANKDMLTCRHVDFKNVCKILHSPGC